MKYFRVVGSNAHESEILESGITCLKDAEYVKELFETGSDDSIVFTIEEYNE